MYRLGDARKSGFSRPPPGRSGPSCGAPPRRGRRAATSAPAAATAPASEVPGLCHGEDYRDEAAGRFVEFRFRVLGSLPGQHRHRAAARPRGHRRSHPAPVACNEVHPGGGSPRGWGAPRGPGAAGRPATSRPLPAGLEASYSGVKATRLLSSVHVVSCRGKPGRRVEPRHLVDAVEREPVVGDARLSGPAQPVDLISPSLRSRSARRPFVGSDSTRPPWTPCRPGRRGAPDAGSRTKKPPLMPTVAPASRATCEVASRWCRSGPCDAARCPGSAVVNPDHIDVLGTSCGAGAVPAGEDAGWRSLRKRPGMLGRRPRRRPFRGSFRRTL